MKRLFIFSMCIFNIAHAQEKDEKASFNYSVEKNISKNLFSFGIGIDPLILQIQDSYINLGVGGGIKALNIMNKFSVEGDFTYYYSNYSFDKNKVQIASFDYDKEKTMSLDFNIGYAFSQEKVNGEIRRVRLKVFGNKEYVSDLPCDVVYSKLVRVGFNQRSFFIGGEASRYDPTTNFSESKVNYVMRQSVANISVGFLSKTDVNTHFKTDRFGLVKESVESFWYVDLLVNISNKFPQVYHILYEDSSYPNEPSGGMTASVASQNSFRDDFNRYPVGARVGYYGDSRKNHDFSGKLEIGLYPGSYTSILQSVGLRMGVRYRFKHAQN
ncbi:MAG: hypothetical protein ACJA1C_003013 [Crocinitomicaceae bacterium]|jgi:hypothetical protein